MSYSHQSGTPEKPRSEPEIIPPGHDRDPLSRDSWSGRQDRADGFVFTDAHGRAHHIRAKRISPFLIIAIVFGIALAVAVILLLLIGAVLVWIPVAAAIVFGLLAFGALRNYWRRLRGTR